MSNKTKRFPDREQIERQNANLIAAGLTPINPDNPFQQDETNLSPLFPRMADIREAVISMKDIPVSEDVDKLEKPFRSDLEISKVAIRETIDLLEKEPVELVEETANADVVDDCQVHNAMVTRYPTTMLDSNMQSISELSTKVEKMDKITTYLIYAQCAAFVTLALALFF